MAEEQQELIDAQRVVIARLERRVTSLEAALLLASRRGDASVETAPIPVRSCVGIRVEIEMPEVVD